MMDVSLRNTRTHFLQQLSPYKSYDFPVRHILFGISLLYVLNVVIFTDVKL